MPTAVNEQDLKTNFKVYNTVQKSKLPEKRKLELLILMLENANHHKRDNFSFLKNL